jgi:uncharacterized membrane protein YphA (DoxX/SURF4 family)
MAVKAHQPIGDSVFAPFFIRCAIGAFFVMAGLAKLGQIPEFIKKVESFGILSPALSTVYGALLPYLEIGVGGLMIIGFWTTLAGAIGSLLLISFIIAFGTFPNSSTVFNKDIILLGGTVSLLFSGAGAFSLDRFRKNG